MIIRPAHGRDKAALGNSGFMSYGSASPFRDPLLWSKPREAPGLLSLSPFTGFLPLSGKSQDL